MGVLWKKSCHKTQMWKKNVSDHLMARDWLKFWNVKLHTPSQILFRIIYIKFFTIWTLYILQTHRDDQLTSELQ